MNLRYILGAACMLAAGSVMAQGTIDATLCDQNANAGAVELYDYLRNEVWGKKVISGSHSGGVCATTEAQKIHELSGQWTKLNVSDFSDIKSHHDVYTGDAIKTWQDDGGVVGFMWHWRVPKTPFHAHTTRTAFYVPASNDNFTYFSPQYATTPATIENKIINDDLEIIKDILLGYQEQGITVIWRPFHEVAGNAGNSGSGVGAWFWWGIDGPDAFRRLWNYVQDFLWENGVHNLIYVWTSQLNDTLWYPGDNRVDIVARDNYDKDNHASKKQDFETLRALWPNKMAALAECGVIPDPDNMVNDNAMWLYVAPWSGDGYVPQQNDAEFMKKFMNHSAVIVR